MQFLGSGKQNYNLRTHIIYYINSSILTAMRVFSTENCVGTDDIDCSSVSFETLTIYLVFGFFFINIWIILKTASIGSKKVRKLIPRNKPFFWRRMCNDVIEEK